LAIRLWLYCAPVGFADLLLLAGVIYGSAVILFSSTVMIITTCVSESPLMKDIRRSGFIIELIQYIAEAIFGSLAAVVVNFVGFAPVSGTIAYQVFWFVAMAVSVVTFIRIAIIYLLIFRKLR
jgi:protein-S-isoprenylcysteine O-methyltransferase Ste14